MSSSVSTGPENRGIATKALIIAAGKGTRIATDRYPLKPLHPLLGIPLIERVIVTASEAGISEFYVVTGYRGDELTSFLDDLSTRRHVPIQTIRNKDFERDNGMSVLCARKFLEEESKFVLLMSDHVFDESILRRLVRTPIGIGEVLLAVDPDTKEKENVDIDDVTKVLLHEGGGGEEDRGDRVPIKEIGKEIDRYNAYDTGIFLCTGAIFDAISEGGGGSISNGMTHGSIHEPGHWTITSLLLRKSRQQSIPGSGVHLCFVNIDPILIFTNRKTIRSLTRGQFHLWMTEKIFVHTDLTPNQISFIAFLFGVLGSVFFIMFGQYHLGLLIGGILTHLSSVVDGCDGEIARLKFLCSSFGAWFDAVLDRYADGFLIFGLTMASLEKGVACSRSLHLYVGFAAIIGGFLNSYMVTCSDKYDGFMKKRMGPGKHYFRIGRDVRLFVIFIGAVLNRPFAVVLFIAILMNLENARRMILLYRKDG